MFNENKYESRLKARIDARNAFLEKGKASGKKIKDQDWFAAILMISESADDYIEHRIETDKVLKGILKDIQENVEDIAENV